MQVAAHGNSTLGIPRAVGQDFVAKTPPAKRSKFAKALAKRRKRRSPQFEALGKMAKGS